MAPLLNNNLKLTGRCHPWCGNRESLVGRPAEKRAWQREAFEDAYPDLVAEYEALYALSEWRCEASDFYF